MDKNEALGTHKSKSFVGRVSYADMDYPIT